MPQYRHQEALGHPDEITVIEDKKMLVEDENGELCPGFAFMTDRRMLFKNFYVDDSTPIRVPGWISDAITRTREVRPPVVIIMDWAINGTEASRFENWAAAYVEALQSLSREKIVRPGLTIYLL